MKRFIIEREMPNVGQLTGKELRDAARSSNDALAKVAPQVQWVTTYIADDRAFSGLSR